VSDWEKRPAEQNPKQITDMWHRSGYKIPQTANILINLLRFSSLSSLSSHRLCITEPMVNTARIYGPYLRVVRIGLKTPFARYNRLSNRLNNRLCPVNGVLVRQTSTQPSLLCGVRHSYLYLLSHRRVVSNRRWVQTWTEDGARSPLGRLSHARCAAVDWRRAVTGP